MPRSVGFKASVTIRVRLIARATVTVRFRTSVKIRATVKVRARVKVWATVRFRAMVKFLVTCIFWVTVRKIKARVKIKEGKEGYTEAGDTSTQRNSISPCTLLMSYPTTQLVLKVNKHEMQVYQAVRYEPAKCVCGGGGRVM